MELAKLQAAATKSAKLFENWMSIEESACRYLANAGNILQRTPALTKADSYTDLDSGLDLKPLLLAKQAKSFELVSGRLQTVMRELEDVVAAQEKQCVDGWAALNARAASALAPVKGVQPLAEATQMIESMEDVWDELCLKAALLSQLHQGISDAEFASLSSLFNAHVHLKVDSTSAVILLNLN